MSTLKKFMLLILAFVSVVLLVGCSDKDARGRLDDLERLVSELEERLDEAEAKANDAEAKLEDLKGQLEDSNATIEDLNKAVSGALREMTLAGVIEPESVSAELKNETTVLGVANQDGIHNVNTGAKFEIDLVIVAKYTFYGFEYEVEFKNEWYQVDYFWYDTADYNDGIVWDEEENTIEFKLPGKYGLVLYALDNQYQVSYDEDGERVSDYPAYQAIANGNVVPGHVKYTVEVADPLDLVTSEGDKFLELFVDEEEQLKIEGYGTEYVFLELTTGNDAVVTVDEEGKVKAVGAGKTAIYAKVRVADDENATPRNIAIPVTVVELPKGTLAGGQDGQFFNFKLADLETKAKILAHMERYLINSGASIPVINNSGLVVYSERVNFIADEYVPLMGYGPTAVELDTGNASNVGDDLPYRMWTSADPSTLNHLAYADSIESDFLGLLAGSLFSFDWKLNEEGRGIGWEVEEEMAARLAYPVELKDGQWVELDEWNGLTTNKAWKFDLRTDLKWETGEAITADDFIFTYKEALNPERAYRRANLWYGSSMPIENAKEYYDKKEGVTWDNVGIKKVDDYSFVIIFKEASMQWDVIYNYSGFMFTPVHRETYEKDPTKYGTDKDHFVASGPYKLSYWEKGKEYRFTKNDQYFIWNCQDDDPDAEDYCPVAAPVLLNLSYTIVKDNSAALELFQEGQLDVTSVPAAAFDDYKDWENQKFVPGATSFRLSVNRMTQEELDAKYGKGAWNAKPILQEDDFMWALYFGLDRAGVQDISKTSTGWGSYFTGAYAIVAPTEDGVEMQTYRQTDWGKKVYAGEIFEGDIPLADDHTGTGDLGFNETFAIQHYVSAVQSMIDKGIIKEGTSANPTKITIEIAHFDGTTQEAIYAYVVQKYNELFNNTEEFGDRIVFEAISAPQPGMDVYYVKQMTGQFDLALAGISGGTLDPMGFMECFCDDNRSGLFLSIGFDSHNPNILIDLDLDGDGNLDGPMYWSFDALYSAYYGKTFVKNGMEAEAPNE